MDWRRKELWHKRGSDFAVEVSHHTEEPYQSDGPNRWCVYAYIYTTHPHFLNFKGDRMWQDAALILPLHVGPSLLRWHYDTNGKVVNIQVGADYNHVGDSKYTHYDTEKQAEDVFRDADVLVKWLEQNSQEKAALEERR